MKKIPASKLWPFFAFIIMGVLVLTSLLLIVLVMVVSRAGYFHPENKSLLGPLMIYAFFSAILGAVLAWFVTKTILSPVADFTRVTRAVSQGDFSVRAKRKSSIAEVSELADNLNLMTKRLSQKETLSTTFIRDVSHEFNTPLSTIEGYATLLQDPTLDEADREEYSAAIVRAAKQLGTLSGTILLLSSLEDSPGVLEGNEYRLDEQIRRVLLDLEQKWAAKDLELDLDLPKVMIVGHEALLGQVWSNLLANAIKFTPERGTVGVHLDVDDALVRVRISDTGIGMDAATQERVFEKFFQGDEARASEGSGLGLALVQRIVQMSGGTVGLTSIPGVGSNFLVALPIRGR